MALAGARTADSASEPLDWNAARRLLEENNLNLKRARMRLAELEEDRDRQWRNWLPQLTIFANIQKSLDELSQLSLSDLTVSIAAPLNIPNPVGEQARAYQLALSCLEAQDNYEMQKRRETIALYRLFSEYRQLSKPTRATPPETAEAKLENLLGERENDITRTEALARIRASLSRTLNLPARSFEPQWQTLPTVDYSNRLDKLVPGKNHGRIAVRLAAYQLQAAMLREKGVEIQQFPSFFFSSSTPNLYQVREGEGSTQLGSDTIALFSGLVQTYEFTGRPGRHRQRARSETLLLQESIRQRMADDALEWRQLKARYREIELKRRVLSERIELVRLGEVRGRAETGLATLRSARETLSSMELTKERLDLEIWQWDDEKWR